jgi:hypothetical protein
VRVAVRRSRLRSLLAASLVLVVGGCTSVVSGNGSPVSRTTSASSTSATPSVTPSTPAGSCPSSYAAPDPNRPRVTLSFTMSADLASVRGTEHIQFTPDMDITELVFRLTANTAPTVREGNDITVTRASADHGGGTPTYTRAGADPSTQGGLLHIPFASTIAAGTTVTADIAFRLTLSAESFDRFGLTGNGASRYAWFASAQPLLAWERGFGWHGEDMARFPAESATSEAMDTDLTVTAPAADTVIMSGDGTANSGPSGTRVWHSTIATARDVSVAVGPFQVSDTVVNGTKLRLGAFSTAERDRLVPEFTRAIIANAARFGPFPFPSLSVARLPVEGGGIEYPSSILMLDNSRVVAVHETAHQWFYAMVGDSQALHPWLDEAFATYAEELADGEPLFPRNLDVPGDVDRSTESYGDNVDDYYFITYAKGATALRSARTAVGPAKWDAAIRCYVRANAWRIANPDDLEAALKDLPAGVAILKKAGALR